MTELELLQQISDKLNFEVLQQLSNKLDRVISLSDQLKGWVIMVFILQSIFNGLLIGYILGRKK